MAKLKLLVLFGGSSNEYEASLSSAAAILRTLNSERYEIVPVGINKKGRWLYFPGDYDEIASGNWSDNPDCSSAVLSPDPAHRGILILEDGNYTLKRIDVIFSVLQGSSARTALFRDSASFRIFPMSETAYSALQPAAAKQ